jgi:hypothetical protein
LSGEGWPGRTERIEATVMGRREGEERV